MKKIGFCFLIYHTINLEELWHIFFKNVDKDKYAIYIHYKQNIPLKYFEQYKINECIPTKYGDVTLIHAHNILFKKAYDDGCYKMINLSQACIPFKSFDYIYDFLCKDNYGYFNLSPKNQCFPRCNDLLKYYDRQVINKSSEWFILNRRLCELVLSVDATQITKMYITIFAPEEHYYITTIHENNLQHEIVATQNVPNDATTFTNWGDMGYKYESGYGLKNYESIQEEELSYLLDSKCLFGRKFLPICYSHLNIGKYIYCISSPASPPISNHNIE